MPKTLRMYFITVRWQNHTFYVNAEPPPVTITSEGPIQGAVVGDALVIHCSATIPVLTVEFMWTGPDGNAITTGERMVVPDTTSSGNTYTSALQFTYLREGDEGNYTCTGTVMGVSRMSSIVIDELTGMFIPLCTCYNIAYTLQMHHFKYVDNYICMYLIYSRDL